MKAWVERKDDIRNLVSAAFGRLASLGCSPRGDCVGREATVLPRFSPENHKKNGTTANELLTAEQSGNGQ